MAQAKIRMIPGRRAGITSLPAFTAPQKTSATFVAGAPVKTSSGVLVAASTTNAGTSSALTYPKKSSVANMYLAMGTAVASSTASIVCARIVEGMEFEGNMVAKSASSAVATASNIGATAYMARRKSLDTHYGWTTDTPGANSASYIQGKITQLVDAASTVNGRVVVAITKGGGLAV